MDRGKHMRIPKGAFGVVVIISSMISSLLAGCALHPGDRTQSATGYLDSRQLSATVTNVRDFSLIADPSRNSGIVAFDTHKLVFEGDLVLLDGEKVMELAPASKTVDVLYKKGVLTVDDGVRQVKITRL